MCCSPTPNLIVQELIKQMYEVFLQLVVFFLPTIFTIVHSPLCSARCLDHIPETVRGPSSNHTHYITCLTHELFIYFLNIFKSKSRLNQKCYHRNTICLTFLQFVPTYNENVLYLLKTLVGNSQKKIVLNIIT